MAVPSPPADGVPEVLPLAVPPADGVLLNMDLIESQTLPVAFFALSLMKLLILSFTVAPGGTG